MSKFYFYYLLFWVQPMDGTILELLKKKGLALILSLFTDEKTKG